MPAQPVTKTFNATTTGVQAPTLTAPGLWHKYAVQVAAGPSGGTVTSWSVTLEGSLDGVNWTVLITHTTPLGSTQWAVEKPVSFVRANVGSLTLGTATSINVCVAAMGS